MRFNLYHACAMAAVLAFSGQAVNLTAIEPSHALTDGDQDLSEVYFVDDCGDFEDDLAELDADAEVDCPHCGCGKSHGHGEMLMPFKPPCGCAQSPMPLGCLPANTCASPMGPEGMTCDKAMKIIEDDNARRCAKKQEAGTK